MPVIRIFLQSQRGKQLGEYVSRYVLTDHQWGRIRDHRFISPNSKRFTVNAVSREHTLYLEVPEFETYEETLPTPEAGNTSGVAPILVELTHKCRILPTHSDLDSEQQRLLDTFETRDDPEETWGDLSDNKCATFFQISHALSHTQLNNGRPLSEYVKSIRRIGGSLIFDTIPDGKRHRAKGWRLHVEIKNEDQENIAADLDGVFGEVETSMVSSTHTRFGLVESYRQQGEFPHLQVVLNDETSIPGMPKHSMADLDLDIEVGPFHRSAPSVVYDSFREKFPDVEGIYEY